MILRIVDPWRSTHRDCAAALDSRALRPWADLHTVSAPDGDRRSYPDALAAAVRLAGLCGDPLLLLEGDKVPHAGALAGMAACPHPVCVGAYPLWPAQTGLPAAVSSAGEAKAGGIRWLRPGDEWATTAGLGIVSLRPYWCAMQSQRLVLPDWGPAFDAEVWRALGSPRIHVHWPLSAHQHSARPAARAEC